MRPLLNSASLFIASAVMAVVRVTERQNGGCNCNGVLVTAVACFYRIPMMTPVFRLLLLPPPLPFCAVVIDYFKP